MRRQVVADFIQAINNHNVNDILSLMTPDHAFIDASGNAQDGSQAGSGWPRYFRWFPDYHIEVESVMETEEAVGVFGYASGTWRGRTDQNGRGHWRLPAAFKAVVEDDRVKSWQVYCDTQLPLQLMNGRH